jgi:hypothetical protein
MDTVNNAFREVETSLRRTLSNQWATTLVALAVLLCLSSIAPNVSPTLGLLLRNTWVVFLIVFLVLLYLGLGWLPALIISAVFVLVLQMLQRNRMMNNFPATYGQYGGNFFSQGPAPQPVAVSTVSTALTGNGQPNGTRAIEVSTVPTVADVSQPSFVDVNTGCGVPSSCQNVCGGQPMPPTALPPFQPTEVSGLCGCDSEGPQGLRYPKGYENLGMGYTI